MTTSSRKTIRSIGYNVLGGLLAYPLSQGLILVLGQFTFVSQGIATAVFVTAYSGMVVVFVVRIWNDVKELTDDLQIFIIVDGDKVVPVPVKSGQPQFQAVFFDEETYDFFQRLLCGFPQEYTVQKLNRLFFMAGTAYLPTSGLQELVQNQVAFSHLLHRLKIDEFVRTDGFSFTIQLGSWESKRKELLAMGPEIRVWQDIADRLIKAKDSPEVAK